MEINKYPYIQVKYNEALDERMTELVWRYWNFKEGRFTVVVKDLEFQFGLTQPKITKAVIEASIATLVLDCCSKCGKDITFSLQHRSECNDLLSNEFLRLLCGKCRSNFTGRYDHLDAADKPDFKLKYFFSIAIWNKLSVDEQRFLKQLLQVSSYKKILRNLQGVEFDKVWKMIEKFERFGLLDFIRDGAEKLLDIRYLPELRQALIGDDCQRENEISFIVLRKTDRNQPLQPHYTKKISFSNDVLLKAGEEFMCSIWHNEDGAVTFKLTPLAQLQKGTDNRECDTLQVGALIKRIMR